MGTCFKLKLQSLKLKGLLREVKWNSKESEMQERESINLILKESASADSLHKVQICARVMSYY